MSEPRMMTKGEAIETMAELDEWLADGGYLIMFGNKSTHPAFAMSMKYRTLRDMVRNGRVFRADLSKEWIDWRASTPRRVCIECMVNVADTGSRTCVGCDAYREHAGVA